MLSSWYEKEVDAEGYLLFCKRVVYQGWDPVKPLPHFHNGVQFAVGLRGEFDLSINGTHYTVREGDICFMNTFDLKQYHFPNGTECYIVLISSSYFNSVNGLADLAFPPYMPKCEAYGKIREYLDYMHNVWDENSLLLKTAFADMFIWLMKKYYPVIPKKPIDRQYEAPLQAIRYISEHYAEDLRAEEVARVFGYSPNYFSHLFHSFTGMHFREYLNGYRIVEYHKLRKERPDLPVSAAAQLCGFSSMNSFYRAKNAAGDPSELTIV